MAISIDWKTKVITIPKTDTTLIDIGPPEIRELNIETFRNELHSLQESIEGMPFDTIFVHNTSTTLDGVVYARQIEIVNGYTVTFEAGNYLINLVGANNNVSSVTNLNGVGLRSANSAGLIETATSGLTSSEANTLILILNLLEADESIDSTTAKKYIKGTLTKIYEKDVVGSGINTTITLTEP